MYVRCSGGDVQLLEADDLKRLHVELVDREESVSGPLGPFGTLDGDHAWLSISELRHHAHASGVGADWDAGFDTMIEFAARNGWLSGDRGSVRAHVVRADGAGGSPGAAAE